MSTAIKKNQADHKHGNTYLTSTNCNVRKVLEKSHLSNTR